MRWIVIISVVILLIIFTITGGRILETQPWFCRSCHEMEDAYTNWIATEASNSHKNCIICHSGPGITGIIEAELRGAKQLIIHFLSKDDDLVPPFEADLPDYFCTKCHPWNGENVINAHRGFETKNRFCLDCHKHREGWSFSGEIRD
ncbi:MAG: hypothetical protein ACE5EA_07085 [Nitrospirota bacterium]